MASCSPSPPQSSVTVLGTGEFGRALASCLSRAGYRVLLASRNPQQTSLRVPSECGSVVSVTEGLTDSDVLVLAVPAGAHPNLPLEIMKNKIIIDVSNRPSSESFHQHNNIGESLQALLPNSHVVKAFNTLSAYALFRGIQQGTTAVPYCGNDDVAKCEVARMIRRLGFTSEDHGSIEQAKQIENIPFSFFTKWRLPVITAITILTFFWILMFVRKRLCPLVDSGGDWTATSPEKLILQQTQHTLALTALTLLTLCYTPGVLVSYIQLHRGSRFCRLPNWMENWLRSRKELGIIALMTAAVHAVGAIADAATEHKDGDWRIYSYFICGIYSLGLMLVLGITSLPSVGAAMSWREFSFVQRYGGWWALVFAIMHVIFYKWDELTTNLFKFVVIAHQIHLVLTLPLLTLLLKLLLLLLWLRNKCLKHGANVEESVAKDLPV